MGKDRSDGESRRIMMKVPMATFGQVARAALTTPAQLHKTRSSGGKHQIRASSRETEKDTKMDQLWSGFDAIRLAVVHAAAAASVRPADRKHLFEKITDDHLVQALDSDPDQDLHGFLLPDGIEFDSLKNLAEKPEVQATWSGVFVNLSAVAQQVWPILAQRLPEDLAKVGISG